MVRLLKAALVLYAGWNMQLASYGADFEQPRSWHFLHARGGLQVEHPIQKRGHWFLPHSCNVSGIKTVSSTPQIRHSQLAWSKSVVKVDGYSLLLTVYTALQTPRNPTAECGITKIGQLEPGTYEVLYLNPNGTTKRLTEFSVPSC